MRSFVAISAGFGTVLDEAWQAKKRISHRISSERIDRLYQVGPKKWRLGREDHWSGWGGISSCLLANRSVREAVRSALERDGVQEMTFAFDSQGAQVIVNDPFIDGDERAGMQWTFMPVSSSSVRLSRSNCGP